ncbi:hypothetical protein BH11BAC7_BH11BAC7_14260 [soil metagenome]
MDQDIKEIVLSFGGVIIGFTLSEGTNYLRAYKEITAEGEAFDFQITAMQAIIKEQVERLRLFSSKVRNYERAFPVIMIMEDQTIDCDIRKVIKFYGRRKVIRDRGAMRLVYLRKDRLEVVVHEIKRVKECFKLFNEEIDPVLVRYTNAANSFIDQVKEYYLNHKKGGGEYATAILKIVKDIENTLTHNIVALKDSVHANLIVLDGTNRGHELHDAIKKFDYEGTEAIADMENYSKEFAITVEMLTDTIEQCYHDIYETKKKLIL